MLESSQGTVSDIRAIVSEVQCDAVGTHTMVSDTHRTMGEGQKDSGGVNLLVSETRNLPIAESPLTVG